MAAWKVVDSYLGEYLQEVNDSTGVLATQPPRLFTAEMVVLVVPSKSTESEDEEMARRAG